ncbi:MAG: prolipoprotein diacylglyceryl transferase [Lachnospiraceae bacterium]|nr:prolipoprotein diacylglyceryl transferase [Lachnospiraceae bacterium]
MNATALIIDNTEITWSAILIVLTIPAWFFYTLCLYTTKDGKKRTLSLFVFLPFGVAFSFLLCRILYWYSHQSRFESLWGAIISKDFDTFSLLGIIPGILLAAVLVRLLHLNKNLAELLDALAPGTAFGIGLLYLTCRYHQSCLGRMVITDERLISLPITAKALNSQGETEYRLAIYFFGFLAFSLIGILTTVFYQFHKNKKGCTACAFLLLFGSAELVLESARYDAGYFPFNGFVSIIQVASAVFLVAVLIYFLIRAVRRKKFKFIFLLPVLLELAALGVTGYLEYLVQRHGDKAVTIHSGMVLSCMLLSVFPLILFQFGNKKKPYKVKKASSKS